MGGTQLPADPQPECRNPTPITRRTPHQEHAGRAAYVGFDRIEVTMAGRTGSFVIRHHASMHARGGDASLDIVAGSGIGDLAGMVKSRAVVDEGWVTT